MKDLNTILGEEMTDEELAAVVGGNKDTDDCYVRCKDGTVKVWENYSDADQAAARAFLRERNSKVKHDCKIGFLTYGQDINDLLKKKK